MKRLRLVPLVTGKSPPTNGELNICIGFLNVSQEVEGALLRLG